MTTKSFDLRVGIRILAGIGLLAFIFIVADYSLPSSKAKKYAYDKKGRLISRTTPNGRIVKYAYDKAGQLKEVSTHKLGAITNIAYPAGDSVKYEYDLAGNLSGMKDRLGKTNYGYDDYNRPNLVTVAGGKKLSYEYDPWNQIKSIALSDGFKFQYQYDLMGHITQVNDGQTTIRYQYLGESNQTLRRLPNGVTTVYEFSPLGRLISIKHSRADESMIVAYRYQHDLEGQIVKIEETTSPGTSSTEYQYDSHKRLIKVTLPDNATVSYEYDAMGNRTSQTDANGTIRYEYDGRGRLVKAGQTTFSYDEVGNVVSKKDKGRSTSYKYDDENRLLEVRAGKTTIRYAYDGDGNRVRRDVKGQVTNYLNETIAGLPQVIAEYGKDGKMSHYLLGGSRVGQRSASGETVYFLEDHLGSTRCVVDAHGQVVARYAYSPFGEPMLVQGTAQTDSLYTGELWDPETQLIYLRSRYYDPTVGRFLSPDPLPGSPADPASFNQYVYVKNDPLNQVDPLGLQGWPPPPFFYNPNRDLLKPHPSLFPYPIPTRPRPELPVIHHWTYYMPGILWDSLRSGEFFYADTPYQHRIRATVQGMAMLPPFNPVFIGLKGVGIGFNRLFALNDAWYYHVHGDDLRATSKLVGLSSSLFLKEQVLSRPERTGGVFDLARRVNTWVNRFKLADEIWKSDIVPQRQISQMWDEQSRGLVGLYPDTGLAELDRRNNIFLPPPGGGGGGGFPLVGGVYLDQTAKIIGELGALTGAVYDPAQRQLILVGDKNTTLPPMKPEYLAAAIRAVYSESSHEPGMTIDPNPQNPHSPLMDVIFFGNTQNTRLGWVMFEADRVMKGYSVGNDNISKRPIESSVSGYQSVSAMSLRSRSYSPGLWSRFWLVPEPVTAKVSEDGSSIVFDPIKMRVKTETMRWEGGKLVPAGGVEDPEAEAFATHFTQQYEDFARENPIYAELKQVTQAVALAKWMKQAGIPVEWNYVRLLAGPPYQTPDTTPAAYADLSESISDGMATRIFKIHTFGGVDMSPQIQSQKTAEIEKYHQELIQQWTAARKKGQMGFEFKYDKRDLYCIALPSANEREVTAYNRAETEIADCLNVPAAVKQLPGLTSYYNSSHNEPSEFGFSWSLLLPRLEFESVRDNGQSQYLSVPGENSFRVLVQRFTLTNQFGLGDVQFDNPSVDQSLNRIRFEPKTLKTIYSGLYPESDGSYRIILNRGEQAIFDPKGNLRAVLTTESKTLYDYDPNNRLVSIRYLRGEHEDKVSFEYDGKNRLIATLFGNRRATFEYNVAGNLSSTQCGNQVTAFRYNEKRLLTEVIRNGIRLAENTYDDLGRLLKQKDGSGREIEQQTETAGDDRVISVKDGVDLIKKTYDSQHRLTKAENGDGESSQYHYDDSGQLSRVEINLSTGGKAQVDLSSDQKLVSIQDPRGVRTEYHYNARHRLSEVIVNSQRAAVYSYDDQDRLAEASYADGSRETFVYDAEGRIQQYRRETENSNATATVQYNSNGGVIGFSNPTVGDIRVAEEPTKVTLMHGDQTFVYQYDDVRKLSRVTAPHGFLLTYTYSSDGRLAGLDLFQADRSSRLEISNNAVVIKNSLGGKTTYAYTTEGLLDSVGSNEGTLTSYSYDNNGRLQRIEFPDGRCLHYFYDSTTGRVVEERWARCPPTKV